MTEPTPVPEDVKVPALPELAYFLAVPASGVDVFAVFDHGFVRRAFVPEFEDLRETETNVDGVPVVKGTAADYQRATRMADAVEGKVIG